MNAEKILNCRFVKPTASFVLICFPWAGGGSNFYAQWGKLVPEFLEVCGVTLSGRESRFRDPCSSDASAAISQTTSAILTKCKDKKLVFWGHSMGALFSFLVAVELKTQHQIEPVQMFVSGVSAPHAPERKQISAKVSNMTDTEFIEFLKRLGGTPKEVIENKELMEIFLPPLRADYTMIDGFEYSLSGTEPPLSCPIHAFDGEDDFKHNLQAWSELTSGEFSVKYLPGGHFYLKEASNQNTLTSFIVKSLV